jgi:hypothetical protein
VKLTHLNKTVAALGMVLFFTFGAFAVSQAYDSAPLGPPYTLELHHLSAAEAPQLYAQLTMPLQFESSDIPEASRPCSNGLPFKNAGSLDFLTLFRPAQIHAAKVSLQILQSALLL